MLTERMIRAAKLDLDLYEEVEADGEATPQALLVVVIVSVATGLGSGLAAAAAGRPDLVLGSLVGGVLVALVGWAIWSYVTYWIGTRLFGGTATYGELLRTIGFAYSPGVLRVFIFIPWLGGLVALAASLWSLVAGVIAVRQALDFTTGKAIATVIVGWLVMVAITVILGLLGFGL